MHLSTGTDKATGFQWFVPYFLITWLHSLFLTYPFFRDGFEGFSSLSNSVFHLGAWPLYAMFYLLPALGLVYLFGRLGQPFSRAVKPIAIISASVCLLLIWIDRFVFSLYSFHINAFVFNLVFTSGGIESLNNSTSTYFSAGLIIGRIFLIQLLVLFCVDRVRIFSSLQKINSLPVYTSFVLLFLAQGISYGISDIRNNPAVLDKAYNYPYFQKVRFRSLATKFGVQVHSRTSIIDHADNSRLQYPLEKVNFSNMPNPPNIIWLVAESLRWDQLTPEIMPELATFAGDARNYVNHYSSGNGTREGMFGMFYGLYGSYWDSFLHAEQSPILIDRMQDLGYHFELYTSAKFSYPEFDKTIFTNMPDHMLHEAEDSLSPWLRDEKNTDAIIDFLDSHESGKPFMAFQFFESTHAPYFFPETHVIQTPYLENVDYTSLSEDYLKKNRDLLLNRYRNAGNWVDTQLGKIFARLEKEHLLDNTIVIVTGDHGEEFMEKGYWGHNSSFVEEQTHVPMVMWLPGSQAGIETGLSSHLDIATTLLQVMGAQGDSNNYSQGQNLLETRPRAFINISDWHSIAVMTNELKVRIPYISTGLDYWTPTDAHDHDISSDALKELMASYQHSITDAIQNTSAFTRSK